MRSDRTEIEAELIEYPLQVIVVLRIVTKRNNSDLATIASYCNAVDSRLSGVIRVEAIA